MHGIVGLFIGDGILPNKTRIYTIDGGRAGLKDLDYQRNELENTLTTKRSCCCCRCRRRMYTHLLRLHHDAC